MNLPFTLVEQVLKNGSPEQLRGYPDKVRVQVISVVTALADLEE